MSRVKTVGSSTQEPVLGSGGRQTHCPLMQCQTCLKFLVLHDHNECKTIIHTTPMDLCARASRMLHVLNIYLGPYGIRTRLN